MSEHIEDHAKLYEATRSLRKTGLKLTWCADEISSVLDELIRLRHVVASGIAVSINQENKQLKADNEALVEEITLSDKIIAERDRLLNMFDCPAHGQCVPYAMEQVEALRKGVARFKYAQAQCIYLSDWTEEEIDAAMAKGDQP